MVTLRYLLEATALMVLFVILRLLPLDTASALGSFLARHIGPRLKAQKIAEQNMAMIFPEKSEAERRKILIDMWDNLGRTAAELPHLTNKTLFSRIAVTGAENFNPAVPALFFSGHLGNWELLPMTAESFGVPIALAYRTANNRYADALIARLRATKASGMFPKGGLGAVKMVRALKKKQSLAMLVDQKMNDGIAAPFFGRDAMTAPAIAQLAMRYNMPIIPARVVRGDGAHFESIIYPPLVFEKTGDVEKDVLAITTAINGILEGWIREYPEQWFWVHKRWPN